jgi:hypothetical protein
MTLQVYDEKNSQRESVFLRRNKLCHLNAKRCLTVRVKSGVVNFGAPEGEREREGQGATDGKVFWRESSKKTSLHIE